MKIQPRNNRILVQPIRVKDGNIILPDSVPDAIAYFRVHAVAPEVTLCKPGDAVLLRPDANILGLKSDENLGICDIGCVFAVVTETEKPGFEV